MAKIKAVSEKQKKLSKVEVLKNILATLKKGMKEFDKDVLKEFKKVIRQRKITPPKKVIIIDSKDIADKLFNGWEENKK